MCGIAGYVHLGSPIEDAESLTRAMVDRLRHRGPDGEGFWAHERGVALGMRRLAIVDLERGQQPQISEDGRVVVVCNGEIYNHAELRAELTELGHRFATDHSDTEVLVHGFEQWGIDCFDRLRGMYGVAIWDCVDESLILARDPVGKKPLYWHQTDGAIAFASEATAVESAIGLRDLDRRAVDQTLRLGYVHSGAAIWHGVRMVDPGEVLQVSGGAVTQLARRKWPRPGTKPVGGTSVDRLDKLLRTAVRRRLRADVPVGIFLSGGLDSSLIAALAAAEGASGLRAFSATFDGEREDESPWSRKVAQHLGCDYRPVHCQQIDESRIRAMVRALDEPLADAAALPTIALSQAAVADSYKVVLTGEGADELFLGYDHYATLARVKPIARVLRHWPIRPSNWRRARTVTYLAASAADRRLAEGVFERFSSRELRDLGWQPAALTRDAVADPLTAAAISDLERYLPCDLLMKVDKSTMSQGLEARVPFLDRDLIDHVAGLPVGDRLGNGRRVVLKAMLREVAIRYLPSDVVNRPKHAFLTPTDQWVRSCPSAARTAVEQLGRIGITLAPDALIPESPEVLSWLTRRQRWALFVLGLWLDEHPHAVLMGTNT